MSQEDNDKYVYINEDYVQSSNCLFHFMSESRFLNEALSIKALCPRYNIEDIEYLHIKREDKIFDRIAVLQKCFCDIPLRNIFKPFPIELTEDNDLNDEEKNRLPKSLTHYDLYGRYAIGFTKKWGEKNRLQPIHYLNRDADWARLFSEMFTEVMEDDNISENIEDTMLNWMCYLKPLRGRMHHKLKDVISENLDFEIFKNFHDEKEWRYVPFNIIAEETSVDSVIANPNITKDSVLLKRMSDCLKNIKYEKTWLHFDYDDIRYLIVPDKHGRKELIDVIIGLKSKLFDKDTKDMVKRLLISKIIVLDEIEKDL